MAGDFFAEILRDETDKAAETKLFSSFAELYAFVRDSREKLRIHLPSRATDNERRAMEGLGAIPL
jgi:hypothetical protein